MKPKSTPRNNKNTAAAPRSTVVLLHGLLNRPFIMHRMRTGFAKSGFRVLNIGYPSSAKTIEQLATDDVAPHLHALEGTVHFVGYSMGGILVRQLLNNTLAQGKTFTTGRVVMIGTPNSGTELADAFLNSPWLAPMARHICGPALDALSTRPQSLVNTLKGLEGVDVGIIAGGHRIEPFTSMVMHEPHDGAVPVRRTTLPGAKDHIVLPVSHIFMPLDDGVIRQAVHFIRHGAFNH